MALCHTTHLGSKFNGRPLYVLTKTVCSRNDTDTDLFMFSVSGKCQGLPNTTINLLAAPVSKFINQFSSKNLPFKFLDSKFY